MYVNFNDVIPNVYVFAFLDLVHCNLTLIASMILCRIIISYHHQSKDEL